MAKNETELKETRKHWPLTFHYDIEVGWTWDHSLINCTIDSDFNFKVNKTLKRFPTNYNIWLKMAYGVRLGVPNKKIIFSLLYFKHWWKNTLTSRLRPVGTPYWRVELSRLRPCVPGPRCSWHWQSCCSRNQTSLAIEYKSQTVLWSTRGFEFGIGRKIEEVKGLCWWRILTSTDMSGQFTRGFFSRSLKNSLSFWNFTFNSIGPFRSGPYN